MKGDIMNHYVVSIFKHAPQAQRAVQYLNYKGHGGQLSVVLHDVKGEVMKYHQSLPPLFSQAPLASLIRLFTGATSVRVPRFGPIVIAGSLVNKWKVSGISLGKLFAGIKGALRSLGIADEDINHYRDRLKYGDVLVAMKISDANKVPDAKKMLGKYGGQMISVTI